MRKTWPSSRRPPTTKRRLPALAIALALAVSCTTLGMASWAPGGAHTARAAIAAIAANAPLSGGLQVSGNHLVNTNAPSTPLQLRGVNRSGTEYACVQGWGIFDGPSDAASVQAIASWGANVVRIPLNEDCWLGINGVPSQYAGANYIGAIQQFVSLLHQNGMYAELSLIWGAPGTQQATSQPAAPDEDHSPAMWASLAQTFASDAGVILAPWGETTVPWPCFQSGGNCGGTGYAVAGMNQAVSVMRASGYHGVIAIPCVDYANDCNDNASEWGGQNGGGDWLSHEPSDPDHNLVGEMHVYGKNVCDTATCLNDTTGKELGSAPFIFGETGETYDGSDCNNSSANISTFMTWADEHGVGYEAWTWDTWGSCNLALITSYSGTPYGVYGTYVQQHLLALAGSGGGTPTPTTTQTATATVTTSPSPPPSPSPTITPHPGGGSLVAMGFAIGYQMPVNPPWADLTQTDLFTLQTTNGTALDTHNLSNVNVPAFVAAAHAHNVQALITIGGSSDQDWQYACTGSNRAGFVSNLVTYMQSNGFDGIDLDIEDDLWGTQGPPSPDMTACIEAISTAAKAVRTQAGKVPLISADVITNWEGPWFAPSQSYVDQFNLMTYGDTTGGSVQADVQATENQGLPAAKLTVGIDVIDAPSTNNQCGPFAQYAQQSGLLGAFVFDESTDEANGYPCFNQFAAYLGGGSPTPTPSPSPSPGPTGTPTNTPSPTPSPSPTSTPPPCAQGVASWARSTANPNPVAHGATTLLATAVRMKCGGQPIIVDFQEFPSSGGAKIGEQWVTVTSSTGMTAYAVAWTPATAGTYYVSTAVFSGDWSVLYNWHDHAIGTLTVK